jgi:hypothetical protein
VSEHDGYIVHSHIEDVTLCSPVDHYQRFGEICAAGKQSFSLVSFLSYSLSLQMEAVCSFETLVAIYWTT